MRDYSLSTLLIGSIGAGVIAGIWWCAGWFWRAIFG
jgi:hypothetical protein